VLCLLTYVLREPRQGNGVFLLEVAGPSSDTPTVKKRHAWLPCESDFCNQSRQALYMIASDLCLVQGALVAKVRTSTHLLIILFFITGHIRNRHHGYFTGFGHVVEKTLMMQPVLAICMNININPLPCILHSKIEPPSTHCKNLQTNLRKLQLRRLCLESSHRALPFLHSVLSHPHDILLVAPDQLL
jgi:hypothetical protein